MSMCTRTLPTNEIPNPHATYAVYYIVIAMNLAAADVYIMLLYNIQKKNVKTIG